MREIDFTALIQKSHPTSKWEGDRNYVQQHLTLTLKELSQLPQHDLERLAMAGQGEEVVEVTIRFRQADLSQATQLKLAGEEVITTDGEIGIIQGIEDGQLQVRLGQGLGELVYLRTDQVQHRKQD